MAIRESDTKRAAIAHEYNIREGAIDGQLCAILTHTMVVGQHASVSKESGTFRSDARRMTRFSCHNPVKSGVIEKIICRSYFDGILYVKVMHETGKTKIYKLLDSNKLKPIPSVETIFRKYAITDHPNI